MMVDKVVVDQVPKVTEMLKNMKSRGIKQRLRKRIIKEFGEVFTQVESQKKKGLVEKINESIDQFKNLKGVKAKKEFKLNKKKTIKEVQQKKEQPKKVIDNGNIEEEAELKVIIYQ